MTMSEKWYYHLLDVKQDFERIHKRESNTSLEYNEYYKHLCRTIENVKKKIESGNYEQLEKSLLRRAYRDYDFKG